MTQKLGKRRRHEQAMAALDVKLAAGGQPVEVLTEAGPETAKRANVTYTEFATHMAHRVATMPREGSYETVLRHAGQQPPVSVPCGTCVACCYHKVDLLPEEAARLDSVPDGNGGLMIRQQDDGACIYLQQGGCSIYADRPTACRIYDCRAKSLFGIRTTHGAVAEPAWLFEVETRDDLALKLAIGVALDECRDKCTHSEDAIEYIGERMTIILPQMRAMIAREKIDPTQAGLDLPKEAEQA
jgi:hypothetical protein